MKDIEYFTEDNRNSYVSHQTGSMAKTFMSSVFSYMFLGLLLTGFTSWYLAYSRILEQYLITEQGVSPLMYVAMFAPLGLVFWMSLGFNRMKASTMLILFIVYAFLNGVAFSSIFLTYNLGAIYKAFGSAGVLFGLMAVVGYTTKTDLTKLGNILYIALIALVVTMLINFFVGSSALDYLISVIGVVIFTGLTAYDVQKLKEIGEGSVDINNPSTRKFALYGALNLYLDFINLFLFLLRLFGGRD